MEGVKECEKCGSLDLYVENNRVFSVCKPCLDVIWDDKIDYRQRHPPRTKKNTLVDAFMISIKKHFATCVYDEIPVEYNDIFRTNFENCGNHIP